MSVLIFDSGIGGLSVLRQARSFLSEHQIIYIGDDAGFPYGDWPETALIERILSLFDVLMDHYQPDGVIVACNTASTLIMPSLRQRFDTPFIGIVPAIKPAAAQTASGLFSVLATPGTIKRQHTHDLIEQFASHCQVNLVGATGLARLAEQHMQGVAMDQELLAEEIAPCFVKNDAGQTDIITLGCTHYPFLINEMRKVAPWPVDWLDPAEAVARRACEQISSATQVDKTAIKKEDEAVMSSGLMLSERESLLNNFGLNRRNPRLATMLKAIKPNVSL